MTQIQKDNWLAKANTWTTKLRQVDLDVLKNYIQNDQITDEQLQELEQGFIDRETQKVGM